MKILNLDRLVFLAGVLCFSCDAPEQPEDLQIVAGYEHDGGEEAFDACEMEEHDGCGGPSDLAAGMTTRHLCGSHVDDFTAAVMESDFQHRLAFAAADGTARKGKPGGGGGGGGNDGGGGGEIVPVTVKVWFHVITDGSSASDVSDARLNQQLNVLNSAYAGTGFVHARRAPS